MSARRGFALLAVLWVITALAAIVGLGVGATRLGQYGADNRIQLERGRWAAEACLSIVEARWVAHRLADTATIDLGRTTACKWRLNDPTARLNVNTAPVGVLAAAVRAAGIAPADVDSLVAHRPYQDTAQVRAVLGADTALLPLLTVDGPGAVNLNRAAPVVLSALPGIGAEAVERVMEYTRLGRPLTSLDEVVSVTPGGREELLVHYAELSSLITFAAPQLVITATGWVGEDGPTGLHATAEELVVPLPERLAVIRRRAW
ncbi:MAG TPA: hypothetical protein VN674_13775 [Gemmatimonadales bacterium]|nr:hypothetical protein [Gemmatimonadales bacterium]